MSTSTRVAPVPLGGAKTSAAMPELMIRLSPLYAWLIMGFGVLFFFCGLMLLSPTGRVRYVGLGLFICALSIGAVIGGNHWRHHLPVVVRMTSRQLMLPGKWPQRVAIDWTNIAAIDKKSLTTYRHGVRNNSEFVCIKLKKPLPMTDPLSQASPTYRRMNEAFMKGMSKTLLGGYDLVINPVDELARDADWFLAECQKRMTPASSN